MVLRLELDESNRLKEQLEHSLGKIGNKMENMAHNYEYKLEIKQKEIKGKDIEIKRLS